MPYRPPQNFINFAFCIKKDHGRDPVTVGCNSAVGFGFVVGRPATGRHIAGSCLIAGRCLVAGRPATDRHIAGRCHFTGTRGTADRKKLVERPLISSYVFVKIIQREYFTVRKTEGVVKFIMIQGKPVPIPEEQIDNLRILCGSDAEVEVSTDVYEKGDMVEVTVGSLTGLRGELIRVGRKHKVVIRVIQPGMNLTVDIKTNSIRKIGKNTDI